MKGTRFQWGFLERLFTRQERVALTLILGVGLAGLALMGWQRGHPLRPPQFVELKVRVNVATPTELAALPGIGPVLAKRIAEHRRRHGRFLTLSDLSQVKGVTPKVLEKVKGLVRFDE